ncbi:unnamed protein product [Ilex paraguariensis]|uniref:Condensin-2 complex subunit H2 n=1 Tax=Ilex paraguariensis TaxID=185542 RepID=A0ABC8RN59_9AQUA
MYRKMNKDQEQPDFSGKFHTVQPLRDLESNWAVDLAKNLEEYLLKICTGEITGEDDGYLSVNFAEAALLLQGSIQVYSRKVEYLYTLVLHALEFISKKSQQDHQPESTPDQAEESGWHAVADEENDPFWGLDDIPVEAKNSLDSVTSRDDPLNHFVKPPANLVVLEGDCLDATGDGGELESYLLVTNDLYRDFILLDPCDAVAVNDFIKGDYKASKWQNSVRGVSSLNSKYRKSFQSPAKHSGGTDQRSSVGKNKDAKLNQSPLVDHCFLFNDCNTGSYPAADIPEDNNSGFEMDNGYTEPRDSDDDDNDDDPWKPLNPHEPGNLKVKPYKKVKAVRREGVNSSQRIPLTTEFPLARLHGPISSELSEMWEKKRRALEKQQELQSPPLYEKLRQSLVHGEQENCATFWNFKDDNVDNDTGTPDFDMPEGTHIDEEGPLHPEKHNDGNAHFDANEDYGLEDPHASLEDLCRSHLDSLLASIAETEKQTEVAARVSTWKQRIEQSLEEQDSRPPFDIHEYGGRVLDRLSLGADSGNAMSFADVCGQEKHDIARTFSALLQLVNNGNVDLERAGSDSESKCYTAANPFYVRLLRHDKRREEVLVQLSKKRAKSPMRKGYTEGERNKSGKENCPVVRSSPSGSTSPEMSSQLNCNFSVKLGKLGGARHTPEGKRRRRSRFVEPVDLHSIR